MIQSIRQGAIRLQDATIRYGNGRKQVDAVRNINLDIAGGEFVSLLGPSGCGKSTILNAIAGFVPLASGVIEVDRLAVSRPGADRGMVFQHHSLFPWKTIAENVSFGLKMRGVPRKERNQIAQDFIRLVGLSGFESHYPSQLSGGMQQRVGIARVLINEPRVMLMDEPFGALDAQTRLMMQELLLQIWEKVRTTVVFVTHDVDEALFLSDRVVIITHRPGEIKKIIPIAFPRPRSLDILASREFSETKRQCLELLREESLKSLGWGLNGPQTPQAKSLTSSAL